MKNILPPRTHTPEMLDVIYQKVSIEIAENSHNQAIMDQLALSSMIVLTSSVEQAIDLNNHQFFKKYWRILTGDDSKEFTTVAQHIRLLECVANFALEELKLKKLIKHHTYTFLSISFQSISQLTSSRHTNEMREYLKEIYLGLDKELISLQKEDFAINLKNWQVSINNKSLGEASFSQLNNIEKITYFANEFLHLFEAQPTSKNIFDAISILHSLQIPISETITYTTFLKELINNNLLFEKLSSGLFFKNAKRFYSPTLPIFKTLRKITLLRTSQHFIVNGMMKHLSSINRGISEEEVILILANSFLEECGYLNSNAKVKLVDLFTELIVEMNILSLGNLSFDEYEELEINESSVIVDAPFKVGNYIQFGSFQDTKIIWTVVDIQEEYCMLLASDSLFEAEFSKLKGELGPGLQEWKGSTIRKYLNDERGFLSDFTSEEFTHLIPTQIEYLKDKYSYNENISKYHFHQKEVITQSCKDKVFLLSIQEVKELLYDQKLPYATSTTYFLRDSNYDKQIVHNVEPNGNIGIATIESVAGIRPVICIDKLAFGYGNGMPENPFRLEP